MGEAPAPRVSSPSSSSSRSQQVWTPSKHSPSGLFTLACLARLCGPRPGLVSSLLRRNLGVTEALWLLRGGVRIGVLVPRGLLWIPALQCPPPAPFPPPQGPGNGSWGAVAPGSPPHSPFTIRPMAPLSRKGEQEATGSSGGEGGRPCGCREPGTRGQPASQPATMASPQLLGALLHLLLLLLLLLLPASGEKPTEGPRNVCLGLLGADQYDPFFLSDTAKCFQRCRRRQSESCNVEKLERYWLNYEKHLVENLKGEVDLGFVKAVVQNLSADSAEDLHFSLKPSKVPRRMAQGKDKPSNGVRLPKSLFRSLPGNRSMIRLAVMVLDIGPGTVFKGPQLSLEDGSHVLNNRLVGLSVSQTAVTGLAEPLEITFSHPRQPPNLTLTCVFWDVTKGEWASRGCFTERRTEGTVCLCDHLTFFALLLRPILDRATAQVLTRISQVGCSVSMVFLAFTIVMYAVLRFSRQRFKSEDAPKIHVALSGSLFLLNLAFLVNVGSGSEGSSAACWARGAIFHYFLLAAFTWMGLEAFHLYLLAIRVFNTYFGHYFLKLSLVGWGLPTLMVIGAGSANSYGLYTVRDQDNRTSLELCWFRGETALHVTVHGYFLVTFLLGAVVLALVAWKIFTLSSSTAGKQQGQSWKGVLTVAGLSSLVGMTWGLAIFTPLGLSTIYIFAIFNSLQGVFIFFWFAVLYLPGQSATTSSSGTARLDQAPTSSPE
ncbi:adhesion G protein-coupled receptor G3 [Oryctolagus cuniculus]|uniref:Adhesion G protein-coupled receptor G3 n=1 Tax=Oryctolagus cuniculus TaxID=9986 RepID=G1TC29_RABIT|nr:adhesion G protein-coupled receptor G3 isoform X2 [Oryctolagus cuniculus]